jgi:hypothetical protein
MTPARSITDLLADHAVAVSEFVARAGAIADSDWDAPRGDGKWSPAQETKHLALGYEAFARDLRGGTHLRLKGKWWQRRLWRWRALPRILATNRLPLGVRAPREVRPPERPGDRSTLLAELRANVSEFEAAIVNAEETEPRRRVTHPYFNTLSLRELVKLCTVHARHHTSFLPAASSDYSAAR